VYGEIVELRDETSTASNESGRRKRAVARSKHGNRVRAPSRSRMNQMRETVREQRELAPRNPYTRTVSVDYVRVYEQTGMRAVRLMRQYASMPSTATRPEAGVDDAPSPPPLDPPPPSTPRARLRVVHTSSCGDFSWLYAPRHTSTVHFDAAQASRPSSYGWTLRSRLTARTAATATLGDGLQRKRGMTATAHVASGPRGLPLASVWLPPVEKLIQL
jgi:hypothetical protein